jgi:two-component system, OmpR family, sensor histidine kinase KdpD
MARLQSGVSLRCEWESMQEIVGAAIATLESRLASHRIVIDVPADLPLVECDAVLCSRLVANLLDNAQRYTPPGSTIRILAQAAPGELRLRVEDDGPGLPASGAEALFEPFARGQREGGPSGSGLGLAICRAVAELHGGHIEALPNSPQGCVFELVLPRREMPAIDAEFREAAP